MSFGFRRPQPCPSGTSLSFGVGITAEKVPKTAENFRAWRRPVGRATRVSGGFLETQCIGRWLGFLWFLETSQRPQEKRSSKGYCRLIIYRYTGLVSRGNNSQPGWKHGGANRLWGCGRLDVSNYFYSFFTALLFVCPASVFTGERDRMR